ncbi:hypothetical protein CsSME_00031774 [Camellia sinensis var. sinensis]
MQPQDYARTTSAVLPRTGGSARLSPPYACKGLVLPLVHAELSNAHLSRLVGQKRAGPNCVHSLARVALSLVIKHCCALGRVIARPGIGSYLAGRPLRPCKSGR